MIADYLERIREFKEITVSVESIEKRRIIGNIGIISEGGVKLFRIRFTYPEDIDVDQNTAGMILTMPAINFTLFSGKLTLNFPVTDNDIRIVEEWTRINNREVFINRLSRRRHEFFLPEYLPGPGDITPANSVGKTIIEAPVRIEEKTGCNNDRNAVAVLSSGGKESLLTSGLLGELGSRVHHIFINESGGHWRTAKTSYDYLSSSGKDTLKIWTNVDRFYKFCLDNMKSLNRKVSGAWADDYPVQLFIFPVYIFACIPLLIKHSIGSLLMGDEFDDPLDMTDFNGISHYYGIYDQTRDFNMSASDYFRSKGYDIRVWSAVYPISGSLEEKILINRYHDLFLTQRSCHSCRISNGNIIPCGKCSKCLGIMLFILAAGGHPEEVGYSRKSVLDLPEMLGKVSMRLDRDELVLMKKIVIEKLEDDTSHVNRIHILPDEEEPLRGVPEEFRDGLLKIFMEYAGGRCMIKGGKWVPV